MDHNTLALKTPLRFLEVFGAEDATSILESLSNSNYMTEASAYCISLYFDKVLTFSNLETTSKIFSQIENIYWNLSAIPAITNIEELPLELKEKMKLWIGPENKIVESDKVTSLKHNDHYVGSCRDMMIHHKDVLFHEREMGTYGKTAILYVDNKIVGSLKDAGENSIMALSTVKNGDYYPMVKGSFYATTEEITNKIVNKIERVGLKDIQ